MFVPNPKLKLQQQVGEVMRFFHYARRTEEVYWHWIRRSLVFEREASGRWRHPRQMGAAEVAAFLAHLALARAASRGARGGGWGGRQGRGAGRGDAGRAVEKAV